MPRIPLPHPLTDRPFSVAEGSTSGVGAGRLRGADLAAPHRGVRVASGGEALATARAGGTSSTSVPGTVRGRAETLRPVMVDGWRFSHVTALALWGLPVPSRVDIGAEPLHVSTPVGRGPRRSGVVGHRISPSGPPADAPELASAPKPEPEPEPTSPSASAPTPSPAVALGSVPSLASISAAPVSAPLVEPWPPGSHRVSGIVVLEGLPVEDPLTAWVRSGALLTLDELIRVGDALAGSWSPHGVARGRPLGELADAISEAGAVRGIARVREAMASVRSGVESPRETDMRLLLTRAGLPEPEINRRTYDARGRYLGKPDLRFRWCKVAVEYEGDEHRRDRRRFRSDILRRERFADAGWRTVRCTGDDLYGRRALEFVARVERCLS